MAAKIGFMEHVGNSHKPYQAREQPQETIDSGNFTCVLFLNTDYSLYLIGII
jgi:hypothetical protein